MPPQDAPPPNEPADLPPTTPQTAGPIARRLWLVGGLLLVGIGGLGILVPGLPTTVFFIGAAACFARSNPRLERWVLNLPHVGPLVRDYRAGLGMPRRAKRLAIATITVVVGFSAFAIPTLEASVFAVALALIGIGYILLRVPTRERVLAERARTDEPPLRDDPLGSDPEHHDKRRQRADAD